MGILKDAILAAIQQEHPDAHWVGNEKPHMIAHNGNSNSTRHL